ncbi:hypothetical protein Belba_1457 [Belliella baltica DSM 15883]|uniref:Uncharacterized protein n=1 Tax=Belliella baltica (strain DSM 15883 / CIP 108006 / LMG 21964 / BA134) TaxID=866536 RepID=I3Z4A6_BELBD|nr:hypothetical protein [Belliella baltica]AFL84074.1 hypothetical protein Belba_1457 [Belliella baltica DSM 15883]
MDVVMRNRRSLFKFPVRNKYLAYAYHPFDIQEALNLLDNGITNTYINQVKSLDLSKDSNPVIFIYSIKDEIKIRM